MLNSIRQYLQKCIATKKYHSIDLECSTYNHLLCNKTLQWLHHTKYKEQNVYITWYICKEFMTNLSNIIHAKQYKPRSMSVDDLLNSDKIINNHVMKIIYDSYDDMCFDENILEFSKCFPKKRFIFNYYMFIKKHINAITKQTMDILNSTPRNNLPVKDIKDVYHCLLLS